MYVLLSGLLCYENKCIPGIHETHEVRASERDASAPRCSAWDCKHFVGAAATGGKNISLNHTAYHHWIKMFHCYPELEKADWLH